MTTKRTRLAVYNKGLRVRESQRSFVAKVQPKCRNETDLALLVSVKVVGEARIRDDSFRERAYR